MQNMQFHILFSPHLTYFEKFLMILNLIQIKHFRGLNIFQGIEAP